VVSAELEIHLQALSYLVTTVIHRLHETDPAWWQETLKEIKAERKALVRYTPGADIADQVLARAIGIVEHSLAQDSPPAKPQKSVVIKDGK
jgi:predicted ATPase